MTVSSLKQHANFSLSVFLSLSLSLSSLFVSLSSLSLSLTHSLQDTVWTAKEPSAYEADYDEFKSLSEREGVYTSAKDPKYEEEDATRQTVPPHPALSIFAGSRVFSVFLFLSTLTL
jgi:hypothetical protein